MRRLNDQQGLVSLLATIIISLLLMVIVIAMVGIMSLLQRQSTDNSDSIRAYYAAEAGVEAALLQVEQALLNGTLSSLETSGCNNTITTNLTDGAQDTCIQLYHTSNLVKGFLPPNGTPLQLDLTGIFNIDHLVISWNDPNQDASTGFSGPNRSFPNTNNGGTYNYPAVLELITASYPNLGSFFSTSVTTNTVVVEPAASGSPVAYNASSTANPAPAPAVYNGTCIPNIAVNAYNCSATINGYSAINYILRLKARYAGAHYQVQAFDASGNIIPIPDEFETIDVTARVGDGYRRLIEKVPVSSGVANLDYVLFADNSICKNFQISQGAVIGNSCP